LQQYGFKVLIAPGFGDILHANSFKNGLLPIVLAQRDIDTLFTHTYATPGYRLSVDLPAQCVIAPDGTRYRFEIGEMRKFCLLNGLDEVGRTLRHDEEIGAFETRAKTAAPWLGYGLSDAPRFVATEPGR
jgi:3-isopropylmalate/(R)-2-methylmalate dehydratase small subunit